MKHILRSLILLAVFSFFSKESIAQLDTKHAIGVRFGSSSGITYRHTLSEDRAFEGILGFQSNSKYKRTRLVGLYQYHKPLANDFSWYYGFGGSIGSFKYKSYRDGNGNQVDPNSEISLSVDGVVGIEYHVPGAPLALSLDVKPYFDFIQESTIRVIDPIGFSIRYKF